MLNCTVVASAVFLNKNAITSCGSAPFFSSSTIRTSVVDSSRQSMSWGTFFSMMISPIFSMIDARVSA